VCKPALQTAEHLLTAVCTLTGVQAKCQVPAEHRYSSAGGHNACLHQSKQQPHDGKQDTLQAYLCDDDLKLLSTAHAIGLCLSTIASCRCLCGRIVLLPNL
jgi:hypothetical protein